MELRAGTFAFPKARDVELRTDDQSFNFNSPVRQAVAMLAGTNSGSHRPTTIILARSSLD